MILGGFISVIFMIVLGVVFARTGAGALFNFFSLIFVVFSPILVIFFSGYGKPFLNGWKVVILNDKRVSINNIKVSAQIFDYLYKASIIAGFVGTLLGILAVFANPEGVKDIAVFRKGMSGSMLAIIYGLVIGFFLYYPIKIRLLIRPAKKSNE